MTITIERFADINSFRKETENFLLAGEAEFNLQLGLFDVLGKNPDHYSDVAPLLAVLKEDEQLVAVLMMTPPFNLVVTALTSQQIDFLIDWLFEQNIDIPGAFGDLKSAQMLADRFAKRAGKSIKRSQPHLIYQLEKVVEPHWPAGKMRAATMHEFDTLKQWGRNFCIDSGVSEAEVANSHRQARNQIESGTLMVWEHDGELKSMAAPVGSTPNGVRIGYVYTPPELRGNGYASAITAALSQKFLDEGKRFCFLFTDKNNPISNSIYAKIGYRLAGEFDKIEFKDKS